MLIRRQHPASCVCLAQTAHLKRPHTTGAGRWAAGTGVWRCALGQGLAKGWALAVLERYLPRSSRAPCPPALLSAPPPRAGPGSPPTPAAPNLRPLPGRGLPPPAPLSPFWVSRGRDYFGHEPPRPLPLARGGGRGGPGRRSLYGPASGPWARASSAFFGQPRGSAGGLGGSGRARSLPNTQIWRQTGRHSCGRRRRRLYKDGPGPGSPPSWRAASSLTRSGEPGATRESRHHV
ncbi:hypothetical protein KIL84_016769 [Mauremys mutica]|uniref:Uncharacterized protein n=1 Tax=Mauremys mutica TaxID=74926 RepID=A0A9D3X577_9SAUR|nr:hypothetical protein KIL84_016769 [Mauremys mutica]